MAKRAVRIGSTLTQAEKSALVVNRGTQASVAALNAIAGANDGDIGYVGTTRYIKENGTFVEDVAGVSWYANQGTIPVAQQTIDNIVGTRDNNELQRWDGAAWVSVGGSSTIGGYLVGSSTTYAALPAQRSDASALQVGDKSILAANDGTNLKGFYNWNGTAWALEAQDPDTVPADAIAMLFGNLADDDLVYIKDTDISEPRTLTFGELKTYILPDVASFDEARESTLGEPRTYTPFRVLNAIQSNGVIIGAGIPEDDLTTAYRAGQPYLDNVNFNIYYASNKSADPNNSPLGSRWKKFDIVEFGFAADFTTTGTSNRRHKYTGTGNAILTIDTDLYKDGDIKEVINNSKTGIVTVDLPDPNLFVAPGGNVPTITLKYGELVRLKRNAGPYWTMLTRTRAEEFLRGAPVADDAGLTALTANDYERRLVKGSGKEYVFKLTADVTVAEDADLNNLADDAATGKWIYQAPISYELLRDLIVDIDNSSVGNNLNGRELPWLNGNTIATIQSKYEFIEVWIGDVKQTGTSRGNDFPVRKYPVDVLTNASTLQSMLAHTQFNNGAVNNSITVAEAGITDTGITFTVSNNDGSWSVKIWGVKRQGQTINQVGISADNTQTGIALSATSTKTYMAQWNGTQVINVLAFEHESTPNGEWSCNHLTGELKQWGTTSVGTGKKTITLPTPFAANDFIVTASIIDNGTGTSNYVHSVQVGNKTTTQFEGTGTFITTNQGVSIVGSGEFSQSWAWIAIGRKP